MEGLIPAIDQHLLRVKTGEVHSPGHLRDAFRDWIESGMNTDKPIAIDEEEKPLSWLIGILWNCSDILPSDCCNELGVGRGSTYAQAVRRLSRKIIRDHLLATHGPQVDNRGKFAGKMRNKLINFPVGANANAA